MVIPRQGCRTGVWKYVVVVSHNDLKFFSNQKRWCVRKKKFLIQLNKNISEMETVNLVIPSCSKILFWLTAICHKKVRVFQVVKS